MSKLSEKIRALPLRREVADCPEWVKAVGQKLYVRELTGAERLDNERYQMETAVDEKGEVSKKKLAGAFSELRKRLVVQTLVDEQGAGVFESTADIAGLSGETIGRLSDQAMKLSGMQPDAVEQAAKNSGASQPGSSG